MGIIGDAQIGKTSLMIKYAEGAYDTEYIQTLGREYDVHLFLKKKKKFNCKLFLGVNFMEKTILIRKTEITFSIWDLGGKTK